MDKDFEKKLKKKRIRTISIVAIIGIIAIGVLVGMNIERADYTQSLKKQINIATDLAKTATGNIGDEKGQYTRETIDEFKAEIGKAKLLLAKDTNYNEKKDGYMHLKDKIEEFKKAKPHSNKGKVGNNEKENKTITVSIEIRCDNLSEDLSKLENPALEKYVPKDGIILKKNKVKIKQGGTVFDVLNKVCRDHNIQIESSFTPIYDSYYIEGINYLYEFDGGPLSGWMYKVNNKFPNYGCSAYALKDSDEIIWLYTCDLGKDVGNERMQ